MSFEESMNKIEELSEKIRDENTSLDDAFKCYEEGIKEYDKIMNILNDAKQKIIMYEK